MKRFAPEEAEKFFTNNLWPQARQEVWKLLLQQRGSGNLGQGWETHEGAAAALPVLQNPSKETISYIADTTAATKRGARIYRFVHIKEQSLQEPESVGYFRNILQFYGQHFTQNEQVRVFSDGQVRGWGINLPSSDYTIFDESVHIRTHLDPQTQEITSREVFSSDESCDTPAINEAKELRNQLFDRIAEMPILRSPQEGQFCLDAIAHQLGLAIPAKFQ